MSLDIVNMISSQEKLTTNQSQVLSSSSLDETTDIVPSIQLSPKLSCSATTDSTTIETKTTLGRRTSVEEAQFEADLRTSLSGLKSDGDQDKREEKLKGATNEYDVGERSPRDNISKQQPSQVDLLGSLPRVECDPLSVLQAPIMFNPNDFIQTASGNKVAVQSVLCGSHKIHMAGKVRRTKRAEGTSTGLFEFQSFTVIQNVSRHL